MQRRTPAALSLLLLTTTALAACTSGDEDTDETATSSDAPTNEAAAPQDPDWFCRLIEKEAVDAATGGRSDEALEVESLATKDEYRCDVVVPTDSGDTEVAMSLSMHRNIPNLADERLAEVKALEGVVPGPEHLGVSYIADTLAVSVVPCKPEANRSPDTPEVPYVFVVRAQLDTQGAATEMLPESLTRLVKEMDMAYGCSPSKVSETDQESRTGSPTGDAGVTTAP
ncbi:hypothetical protein [Ornithinimicrobium cavernae]|uniref:hypothetical protein n=1 Tax=Ornithinimicrobium cavernae TaxID=2666047 RepID=UPI000D69F8B8|nr:hypothetical protein [Ornithinimicrobium cavernae]